MDVSSARSLISNKNSNTQEIPKVRDTQYWKSKIKYKSAKSNLKDSIANEEDIQITEPIVEESQPVVQQVMHINDYRENPVEQSCEDIINGASITNTTEVQEMHVMDDCKSTKGSIVDNRCESPSNYLMDLLGIGLPDDYDSPQGFVNEDNPIIANEITQPVVSEQEEATSLKSGIKYKLAYVPENILDVLAEIVECPIETELNIKGTTYALVDINKLKE